MVNSEKLSTWEALIVDDNADNLNIAAQLLSFHGAGVHTAQSGSDALKILEKVKPTFILLDLTMPDPDGWQMLKIIRSNPSISATPVIALTGHATDIAMRQIKEAGFNGHITKPYLIADFLKSIKDVLKQAEETADSDD
ncbi:MAG: response regulator [Anaerolineae bacterium]|nr:response regulator [Anaerolineae bacterium]